MALRPYLLLILFSLCFSISKAQFLDTRTLIIPTAGAGIPYSGTGLNIQVSKAHFGGWIGYGYNLTKFDKTLDPFTTGPAYDFNIGAKYYFNPTPLRFYWLNVALCYGHVYDYIDLNVPAQTYKSYARGIAGQLGCDFFIKKKLVLSLDLLTAPHYTLTNGSELLGTHGLYWAVAAGLGYKFSIPTINEREDKSYSRRLYREDCFTKEKTPQKGIVQGVCGNTLLYKQLDSGRYIFIDINMDSIKLTPNCQDFPVDPAQKGLKVYVAKIQTVNDSVCCQLYNHPENTGDVWNGIKGTVNVFVNRKEIGRGNKKKFKISAKVTDLELVNDRAANRTMTIKEVTIWDAHAYRFCNVPAVKK